MEIPVQLKQSSYSIIIERGCLGRLHQYISLQRKVYIISDDGIPTTYAKQVQKQCKYGFIHIIPQGEKSKSLDVYQEIIQELLNLRFSRKDLIVTIGGGVVSDLGGFVAATYMRGIDFVNIPTTTLAQIDASIGGKVAVNISNLKNIIGAFYQPKLVCIDPDTLQTLPKRHYVNGIVEAIKAGLLCDSSLFELIQHGDIFQDYEVILQKAILVKKRIVEKDEKEAGLRTILNFGHTLGHALESCYELQDVLHGECVAIGMLAFTHDPALKKQLCTLYEALGLATSLPYHIEDVYNKIVNDKKTDAEYINIVELSTIGIYEIKNIKMEAIKQYL
ncbi:MAG: 3-dehydroquinate synthase [Erysipelotrichaceae bacterium]|nr:3-dehydroquinate synthase [Erysipelotrichaceae bacterium]